MSSSGYENSVEFMKALNDFIADKKVINIVHQMGAFNYAWIHYEEEEESDWDFEKRKSL